MDNKVVFEEPPKESFNIKVNLEFLKGICLLPGVVKDIITIPKVVNDWFIFCASFNLCPSAPVFAILSGPAKSTNDKWFFLTKPSIELYINSNCNMAWLLELLSFWLVAPVALFLLAKFIPSKTDKGVWQSRLSFSGIIKPSFESSLIFNPSFLLNKHFIFSL